MGIYKKIGVRKLAIYTTDLITLIRSYGLKESLSLFRGFAVKKNSGYQLNSSFFRNPVYMRNNYSDRAIFRQVFLEQQYKVDEMLLLKATRIIDAGANIGFGSLYFAKLFPQATIVAIEPEVGNFAQLQKNIVNYPNIIPQQAALWSKVEKVSIANPDSLAASFMVEPTANSSIDGLTIESILESQNWDTVDIVKIDIEGAEKEVFSVTCDWLAKTKLLIVELHDRYKPGCTKTFFKALEGYEYEAYFHHENIFVLFKHNR